MDDEGFRDLLQQQDGVGSRRQVLVQDAGKADLERMVRRRELTCVQTGVYVDHTGPLTWRQRAWSAALPTPSRQALRRGLGGLGYRDVEYDDYGLVVELPDGCGDQSGV